MRLTIMKVPDDYEGPCIELTDEQAEALLKLPLDVNCWEDLDNDMRCGLYGLDLVEVFYEDMACYVTPTGKLVRAQLEASSDPS